MEKESENFNIENINSEIVNESLIIDIENLKIENKEEEFIKVLSPLSNNNFKPKTISKLDLYTSEILKKQYQYHKEYVILRKTTSTELKIPIRLPCIPEDISENIIKFIIINKLGISSKWSSEESGDLISVEEGKQECKCFTSDGPLSFTPSSEWDVIYFLDGRDWFNDNFILYKVFLKRSSEEWKNIKVNKTETFYDQSKKGRRPRITWNSLKPQIIDYCSEVFRGNFNEIFIQNIKEV